MKNPEQSPSTIDKEAVEVTPQHRMFARELLAITGFQSLEELQTRANLITVGSAGRVTTPGRALDRLEITSQKNIEDEGERCQLCHQPIKYQHYLRVNGIANDQFIGTDCAQKVLQFLETGSIKPVSSKRRSQFVDMVIDTLGVGDRAEVNTIETEIKKPRITKQAIVSSMLTWLEIYFENHPNTETQELRDAVATITKVGYYPDKITSEKIVEFYAKVRTFDPLYKLDNLELRDYEEHPHKQMLERIFTVRRTEHELNRIRRILAMGYLRSLGKKSEAELRAQERSKVISTQWDNEVQERKEGQDKKFTSEYLESLKKEYEDAFVKEVDEGVKATLQEEKKMLEREQLQSLIQEGVVQVFPNKEGLIIGPNLHLIKKYNEAFGGNLRIEHYVFEIKNDEDGKREYHYYAHEARTGSPEIESTLGALGTELACAREYQNNAWHYLHLYAPVIAVDGSIYIVEKNGKLTPVEEFSDSGLHS